MEKTKNSMVDLLTSLSKQRGFVFQSSEIYGGLGSTWDYGPLGVELKKNIKDLWWKRMVTSRENVVGMDASILMHPTVWEASGHVDNFHDPLVDNKDSKKRYRLDHLLEDQPDEVIDFLTTKLFSLITSIKTSLLFPSVAKSSIRIHLAFTSNLPSICDLLPKLFCFFLM